MSEYAEARMKRSGNGSPSAMRAEEESGEEDKSSLIRLSQSWEVDQAQTRVYSPAFCTK